MELSSSFNLHPSTQSSNEFLCSAETEHNRIPVNKRESCNKINELECGPTPNVMVALPNIGGALCSTPQSLADAHYHMPRSNAAKTRKPLKVAGVPQTRQQISAVGRPKFVILWRHVEEVLLLNKFFFQLSIGALVAKIQPDKVVRWCQNGDFLHPVYLQRAACRTF